MDQSPANLYIHNIISVYSGYPNCFPGFHAHNLSVVSFKIKGAIILEWVQSVWKTSLMHQEEDRTTKNLRWRLELKTSYRPINQPFPSLFHWMARWSLPTTHWFFIGTGWEKVCFTQKTLTCSKPRRILSKGKMKSRGFHEIQEARASHVLILFILNRPMSLDEMRQWVHWIFPDYQTGKPISY